jgi:hypothetical protein
VDTDQAPPATRSLRRMGLVALVGVVIVAAVVIGFAVSANAPLPELAANYKCAPASSIPQVKVGTSATLTASYGGFAATFHSVKRAASNGPSVGTPFSGVLTMSSGGQSWTLPKPFNTQESSIDDLCVIAFQREQHPGVMAEGFTGGAHCCEAPVIYLFNQAHDRYDKVVDMTPIDFENPHAFDPNGGFIPIVAKNHVLLKTSDGDFAYVFDCYACSATPIVIDSVGLGGLTDVTLQHSSLVTTDARGIWKAVQLAMSRTASRSSAVGLLPAWVADECALDRGAAAWSTIVGFERKGELIGAAYIAHLRSFLLQHDYCTGEI